MSLRRRDFPVKKAPKEPKSESCFWHGVRLMTHAFGGDHSTWSHPVVVMLLIMTLIGCCYGIAQNWQKSVAGACARGPPT